VHLANSVGPIWSFRITNAGGASSGVELKRGNEFFQVALRQIPQVALRQIGAPALEFGILRDQVPDQSHHLRARSGHEITDRGCEDAVHTLLQGADFVAISMSRSRSPRRRRRRSRCPRHLALGRPGLSFRAKMTFPGKRQSW
jgi:hypothetical protein